MCVDSEFPSSSSSWWYPWAYPIIPWGVGQWLSHTSPLFFFSQNKASVLDSSKKKKKKKQFRSLVLVWCHFFKGQNCELVMIHDCKPTNQDFLVIPTLIKANSSLWYTFSWEEDSLGWRYDSKMSVCSTFSREKRLHSEDLCFTMLHHVFCACVSWQVWNTNGNAGTNFTYS